MVSFGEQKLLISIKFNLSFFAFIFMLINDLRNFYFLKLKKKISLVFSSSFIISVFLFYFFAFVFCFFVFYIYSEKMI